MRRTDRDPYFQKKSLGQVFLRAEWPVLRMVEKLKELRVDRVLEIGPGGGILTRGLLKADIAVTAVEKDARFADRLTEYAATLPGSRLNVINADILRFDWGAWLTSGGGTRPAVVGNIPYNISSPIFLKGLEHLEEMVALLFMTQLEFAARLVARPNTKDYGSLSVFAQLRAEMAIECKVERTCFQPVPKVDSAIILATPKREKLPAATLRSTELVARAAFTQRRKKLRNSIRQFLEGKDEGSSPIDLERRADALSPKEFVLLAAFLTGG